MHEMHVLPERRDGDLIIYAANEIQPQQFDVMNTHVSYWVIVPRP